MQQKVKVELVTAKQRVNLFDRFDTEEGEVEQQVKMKDRGSTSLIERWKEKFEGNVRQERKEDVVEQEVAKMSEDDRH